MDTWSPPEISSSRESAFTFEELKDPANYCSGAYVASNEGNIFITRCRGGCEIRLFRKLSPLEMTGEARLEELARVFGLAESEQILSYALFNAHGGQSYPLGVICAN